MKCLFSELRIFLLDLFIGQGNDFHNMTNIINGNRNTRLGSKSVHLEVKK